MTDSLTLPPAHHLKIALVEPEIPQNVGNIARLCAVTGSVTVHGPKWRN